MNNDNANWCVFFAQSFNAKDLSPTFRQVIASDHVIHGSNISTGGLLGAANRNLLDYFQRPWSGGMDDGVSPGGKGDPFRPAGGSVALHRYDRVAGDLECRGPRPRLPPRRQGGEG